MLNYAKKCFGLRIAPTISIKPFLRAKPKPKFKMRNEFEDRVQDVKKQDYREPFILMFYTGLRVAEAMALVWADYNKIE